MEDKYQFKGNVILKGKIHCDTGLGIGGNKESFEIGGIDNPVIRDPVSKLPYIPGSSLKGKMRSLVEWDAGKVKPDGTVHQCKITDEAKNCPVCRIFGTSAGEVKIGPTRLIVRDCYPTEETIERWKSLDTGLLYTEWKKENTINRVTSEANPRDMERVPKDSEFEFEMVYGIYDINDGGETDWRFIDTVFEAIKLLEDSTLGGSGSRGYGVVTLSIEELIAVKSRQDYKTGTDGLRVSKAELKEKIEEHLEIKKVV
jgi:CRISPR-associated protein Csm3